MKRLFATLLLLAMVLSLGCSAWADDSGSMTVNDWPDTSVMPERNAENPTWPSVTGYYCYSIAMSDGSARDVYEYIPEEMGTKRPTVIVAGPDGADALTFLVDSGWKAVADEYKFDIVYAEAKDGVWASPELEDEYIDNVVRYCTSNLLYRHGGQCAFYLAGYEQGADVLTYQLLTYPQFYAGAALLGGKGADTALLDTLRETPSADPSRMMSDIPVQVWIAAEEKTDAIDALVEYFVEANNCCAEENLIYSDKYADELYHPLGWLAKTNQITDADVSNVYVNYGGLDIYDSAFTAYLWGDVLRHVQWAPAYTAIRATRYWAEPEELGFVRETLPVNGINREMYIYVPESVKAEDKVPLVICFHGMNVNGNESAVRYGWSKVAEERSFILVCPTGSQQDSSFATNFMWNPTNDIPFASALIDYMIEAYPVDATRVYTTGSSNGSMMAMWVNGYIPEKIAASASYDMTLTLGDYPGINEDITIALMAISGSYDPNYGSQLSTGTPTEAFLSMEAYMQNRLGLGAPLFYKNGNYEFYTYLNEAGIPLFVYEDCITRIHADMPEDCYVCYDFMAKYSRDADGILYYMGMPVD